MHAASDQYGLPRASLRPQADVLLAPADDRFRAGRATELATPLVG
jgi:hypothetical protein